MAVSLLCFGEDRMFRDEALNQACFPILFDVEID